MKDIQLRDQQTDEKNPVEYMSTDIEGGRGVGGGVLPCAQPPCYYRRVLRPQTRPGSPHAAEPA